MKGYIFDDVEVELDPRTIGVGGSWGQEGDGRYVAGDWYLVRFFFEQMLKYKNPTILDVGAGTGSFCLLPLYHPARVHAFEPHPGLFPILESNIAVNNLQDSVTPYPCALSNKKEAAILTSPSRLTRFSLATIGNLHENVAPLDQRITHTVAVTTIDHLDVGLVDMIKIDVEGAEKLVLEGGKQTIRACMPDILLEYTAKSFRTGYFNYKREEIVWLLKSWGYRYLLPVGNEDLWVTSPLNLQK